MKLHWDLFCSVVDNYGDIGIVWRVARELAHRQGQAVRLWVDDLASFRHIHPAIRPGLDAQICEGIEIRHWIAELPDTTPGDVVVEAFACRAPDGFLQAMARREPKPVWINLEYFSAEDWVAGCHGLGSPHPRLPLTQYFFIPGIGPGTGGILGDRAELRVLDDFQDDTAAVYGFWRELGAQADAQLRISLFAYENPAIPGLIEAFSQSAAPIELLVPEGRPLAPLARGLNLAALRAGECHRRGHLTVRILPFLSQAGYDRLLWSADLNFVRGEDSFMRAQQAGRPLVWQAYVQDDGAHHDKVAAFLRHHAPGLPAEAQTALREAWRVWNAGEHRPEVWREWMRHLPAYAEHARNWRKRLRNWPNTVEELAKFAFSKL